MSYLATTTSPRYRADSFGEQGHGDLYGVALYGIGRYGYATDTLPDAADSYEAEPIIGVEITVEARYGTAVYGTDRYGTHTETVSAAHGYGAESTSDGYMAPSGTGD